MILEQLLQQPKENRREFLNQLSDENKTILFSEIDKKKKESEEEFIRIETKKKTLESELSELMEKLKTLGINSEEELISEINSKEEQLNSEILKFTEILEGE